MGRGRQVWGRPRELSRLVIQNGRKNVFDREVARESRIGRAMQSTDNPAPKRHGTLFRLAFYAVALIGLAAYFILPNYLRARAGDNLLTCRTQLKNIGIALTAYAADHQGKFPGRLEELSPDYLVKQPKCPAANTPNYTLSVGVDAPYNAEKKPDYFFVACSGEHHSDVGLEPNFPALNSVQGLIERTP